MREVTITIRFPEDVRRVWEVVTDNEDTAWRSDLSRTEASADGREFTEYTKKGFRTDFIITLKQPYSRYEFRLQNRYIRGYWTGIFSELPEGGSEVCFTETIEIKNPFMRILARLFMDLKKMQRTYIHDLRKKLQSP